MEFSLDCLMYLLTPHFVKRVQKETPVKKETDKIYVNNYNTKPAIFQLPHKLYVTWL